MGKRVLVQRKVTERPEGVESGRTQLASVDKDRSISAVLDALQGPSRVITPGRNPFAVISV